MKTKAITTFEANKLTFRSIEKRDIEVLRIWKNQHNEFFFYKKEITFEEQEQWFKDLNNRLHDHMFIVTAGEEYVGCIGARLYQECIDIYNVILGDKKYSGQKVMSTALYAIVAFCNLIYRDKPIRVRVLRNNPAINWYKRIGFRTIDYFEDHVLMEFNPDVQKQSFLFKIEIFLPI
jgi:RimJ/RimL family protein N-acetyltransferase